MKEKDKNNIKNKIQFLFYLKNKRRKKRRNKNTELFIKKIIFIIFLIFIFFSLRYINLNKFYNYNSKKV